MLLSMDEVETVRSCLAVLDGKKVGPLLNSVEREAVRTLEQLEALEVRRQRVLFEAGLWPQGVQ